MSTHPNSRRPRRAPLVALAAALPLLGAPRAELHAQTVVGVVTDTSGAALAGAELFLLDLARSPVRTSAAGAFTLADVGEGKHRLRVRRMGYQALDVTIALDARDTLSLVLELRQVPQRLAGVRVIESDRTGLGERRRRAAGGGTFITREQIDSRTLTQVSELLRRAPTIDVLPADPPLNNGRETRLSSRRARVGTCTPRVFLDGSPVEQTALSSLSVDAIQAIEIYAGGAGMPAQFIRNGSDCGAVVVWTRDQLPTESRGSRVVHETTRRGSGER